jgi:hypothetical protein
MQAPAERTHGRGSAETTRARRGPSLRHAICRSHWYPELLGYPQRRPIGYLKQDQRHRAHIWIGYDVTLSRGSLSVAMLQGIESGHAYSAVAEIDPTRVVPGNPGCALNQIKNVPYFFSGRGAHRTDGLFSTDLSLTYEIPIRSVRMFVKSDVMNVFNNATVIAPDTTVSVASAFNPFTQTPVEGTNYRRVPTFGKPIGPTSYQTSRTFQFIAGARF